MIRQTVHMRDQKANQQAMRGKNNRIAAINMAEEITLVVVLWGVFFIASAT
jgi:hypothetical protein